MTKFSSLFGRAVASLAALLLLSVESAPADAQAQRDMFNGRFGVVELPLPPAEAAREAELMGAALAGLAPQRPGVVDVYIVSAGLWGDPVFEREASQAAVILNTHFADEIRSIVLAAGRAGQERAYPAATPNNLLAAIGKVGAVIDPDEDLFVLFLTTHGGPDGTAALREHDRLYAGLRPVHLRDALAAAGLRTRVVIVSACYSGAFIAPLANEDTIVITAAAPDRSSFGCQPENEWTFFGDAYFNHAVREGEGLVAAFDSARALIAQWERERNMSPPSNPQRYVGFRAAARLADAESAARGR